jgi:hypothetical protein
MGTKMVVSSALFSFKTFHRLDCCLRHQVKSRLTWAQSMELVLVSGRQAVISWLRPLCSESSVCRRWCFIHFLSLSLSLYPFWLSSPTLQAFQTSNKSAATRTYPSFDVAQCTTGGWVRFAIGPEIGVGCIDWAKGQSGGPRQSCPRNVVLNQTNKRKNVYDDESASNCINILSSRTFTS